MSMTVITVCIGWLINVTDINDARWKPENKSIYTLTSQQCLGLPCDLFPSGFPSKTVHMYHMAYPSHLPQSDHPTNI